MYRLIAFEGISGSGKTTLYESVRKHVGQTNLIVHRWTPTKWVYDRLYKRNEVNTSRLIELERQLVPILDPLIVWCVCDPEIAAMRKIEQGDLNVEPDLGRAQLLYWSYMSGICQFEQILVRTDQRSVEDCTWDILMKFNHKAQVRV